MAECATKPTYVKDNNGLITWTNPNAIPVTVTVTPTLTGFPLIIAANGTVSATVTVPTEAEGTTCYEFSYDCADDNTGTESKTLSVTAPAGPYAEGGVINHIATVNNTGTETLSVTLTAHGQSYGPFSVAGGSSITQPINYTVTLADTVTGSVTCVVNATCVGPSGTITDSDSVTSQIMNDSGDVPQLICPPNGTVITDPNYAITWVHSNPTSTVVNYDPRVNGIDPGPSVTYPATTFPVTLTNYVQAGTAGTATIEILYWYDTNTSEILSAGTCDIQYDFTSVVLNSDMITCDPTNLQKACDYEDLYFQHVDTIHNRVQTVWDNQFGSRGSPTANEMYFWKNPYESMARAMVLAKEKGLTSHVTKYQDLLMEALNSIMPRMFEGADAANTGSGSKYQNNGARTPTETRYNYLSISRALAWVGYVTFILKKCGGLSAAEESFLDAQQPRLKIMADWLNSDLTALCATSHGGFAHMPTHLVAGMCFLEENGGYNYPQANTCLQTTINYANANNGSLGSDLSHDQDSLGNLMIIRDKQLCGATNISPAVTSDVIELVGNLQASRISSGATCVGGLCESLPDHIGVHAQAIGCSTAIDNLVPAAVLSNFPAIASPTSTSNSDFLNQMQSVIDAAGGYAQAKDGEVCP